MLTTEESSLRLSDVTSSYYISDHSFVSAKLSIEKPPLIRKKINVRKLKSINTELFRKSLTTVNSRVLTSQSLCEAIEAYNDTLLQILNEHAPVREKTITVREVVPWFSKDLGKLKTQLRCLERTAVNLRNSEFWQEYRHVRNCYNKCIKWAKQSYINRSIQDANGDTIKLFSFLDSFIGKSKCSPLPEGNDQEIADSFADFFFNKIEKIRAAFDPSVKYVPSVIECMPFDLNFEICEDTILEILKKSKATTCTNDPIPT